MRKLQNWHKDICYKILNDKAWKNVSLDKKKFTQRFSDSKAGGEAIKIGKENKVQLDKMQKQLKNIEMRIFKVENDKQVQEKHREYDEESQMSSDEDESEENQEAVYLCSNKEMLDKMEEPVFFEECWQDYTTMNQTQKNLYNDNLYKEEMRMAQNQRKEKARTHQRRYNRRI